jgi:hypothetical protein
MVIEKALDFYLCYILMNVFRSLDIDECWSESDHCHDNANCTNTIGSYTCQCWEGFTGNGIDCAGIGEKLMFIRKTIIDVLT